MTDVSKSSSPETKSTKDAGLDDMLLYFAKVSVMQVAPRNVSGKVRSGQSGHVMTVQASERVSRAFYKLVTEGFLSCPIVDAHNHFVGVLDMFDLVKFTLDLFDDSKLTPTDDHWTNFLKDHKKFLDSKVEDVLKAKGGPTPSAISSRYSILNAMEMFAAGTVRRVPVINDTSAIIGICTQSMIVSLLSQGLPLMTSLKGISASALYEGKTVHSIQEDQKALDGFKLMMAQNVQGIAVVDKDGALVDDLSVRDLRGIGTDAAKFRRLQLDVKSFKKAVRAEDDGKPRQVVTVTSKDTLETVLHRMDDGNVHRVFEVAPIDGKSGFKPVGVISQVDIIRFILKKSGVGQQPLLPAKMSLVDRVKQDAADRQAESAKAPSS